METLAVGRGFLVVAAAASRSGGLTMRATTSRSCLTMARKGQEDRDAQEQLLASAMCVVPLLTTSSNQRKGSKKVGREDGDGCEGCEGCGEKGRWHGRKRYRR